MQLDDKKATGRVVKMTTKLKIDLSQGILEVEGSETFVKAIYKDFKIQFLGEETAEEETKKPARVGKGARAAKTRAKSVPKPRPAQVKESTKPTETVAPRKAKKAPPAPSYTYVENLELGATGDHLSLVEFMDSKLPITNEERNLVFLYYLQHVIKRKPIKIDDVYTCYRKGNIRAPLNLENSLKMTAEHENWIKITKIGNMSVTAAGKRYVDQQLPKKVKS